MTEDPPPPPPAYPGELTELAYLDDGTAVTFRAIRPDDDARLERLFYRLSPQSLYLRFFTPVVRPNHSVIEHLVNVDYTDRLALVAVIGDEVVGVARYDRLTEQSYPNLHVEPGDAEAAVIVEDAWQGRGIATRLLWRLTSAAAARGITAFTGSILASNRRMAGLLSTLGEDVQLEPAGPEYLVRLRLAGVSPRPAAPNAADGPAPR